MTRDKLLAELALNQQSMAAELEPLREELAKVVAEIERQEFPRKERERLGLEISGCRERASVRLRELKAAVEKSAPTFLRDAIQRVRNEGAEAGRRASQDPFLGSDHRTKLRERAAACDAAVTTLEKLVFQPGDLAEPVKKILVELATSGLAEPTVATLPAVPTVNDDELVVGR